MASAHAPRRRRHKAGSGREGGAGASGLAERWFSRRKLPKARGGAHAGGRGGGGGMGVGNFGRGSESGSACEFRPEWGWGRVRGARSLGVSALFSHAAGARARARGKGGGAAGRGPRRLLEPWVSGVRALGGVPPACGMGNEAFLRSKSITSFSSQEPAVAAATATATTRHESGFLPWRVAEPSSPSPHLGSPPARVARAP